MESGDLCVKENILDKNDISEIDSNELYNNCSNNKGFLNIKRKNDKNIKDLIVESKLNYDSKNNINNSDNHPEKSNKIKNTEKNKDKHNHKFRISISVINKEEKDDSKDNLKSESINDDNKKNEGKKELINKNNDKQKYTINESNIKNLKFKEIKIKIKENEFHITIRYIS